MCSVSGDEEGMLQRNRTPFTLIMIAIICGGIMPEINEILADRVSTYNLIVYHYPERSRRAAVKTSSGVEKSR